MSQRSRQAGFTLIELLVVVVAITVVIALFRPATLRGDRNDRLRVWAVELQGGPENLHPVKSHLGRLE